MSRRKYTKRGLGDINEVILRWEVGVRYRAGRRINFVFNFIKREQGGGHPVGFKYIFLRGWRVVLGGFGRGWVGGEMRKYFLQDLFVEKMASSSWSFSPREGEEEGAERGKRAEIKNTQTQVLYLGWNLSPKKGWFLEASLLAQNENENRPPGKISSHPPPNHCFSPHSITLLI